MIFQYEFFISLTGQLWSWARVKHPLLVDVLVVRHVLDDHARGHQPLTVIIRNLKPKLILKEEMSLLKSVCYVFKSYLNHKHDFHVIKTVKTEIIDKVGIRRQL